MITYFPNIPNPPNDPSVDVPNMQSNTNAISQFLTVDHVGFNTNSNPNGYHKTIHQVPVNVDPATIAGIGQIYSKNVTVNAVVDSQLFFRTALGGISQLTGNSAGANGYQWIGGVLVQWGLITGLSGSWPTSPQALVFSTPNIPFPTVVGSPFIVLTTFIGPSSSSSGDISINSKSNTGFTWQFSGSSSAGFGGFYWLAIGN